MSNTGRQFVVPAYLFLCLLLAEAPKGSWGNMVLQLLAW